MGCLVIIISLLFILPSHVYSQQKEVEVTNFFAKVYVAPSKNANFIGLIQKGERYPVILVKDNWYRIRFKGNVGWIEFSKAKIIGETPQRNIPVAKRDSVPQAIQEKDVESIVSLQPDKSDSSSPNKSDSSSEDVLLSEIRDRLSGMSETNKNKTVQQRQVKKSYRSEPSEPKPPSQTKKESRIRSWFTQQNDLELPTVINPNALENGPVLFFQVSLPSGVRYYLDPDSPVIGFSQHGEIFHLLEDGNEWCKIAFKDTTGWIQKKTGKILDSTSTASLDYVKVGIIAGIGVIGMIMLIIVIIFIHRKRNSFKVNKSTQKNVFIISKTSKTIDYSLTNGKTSLSRCFSEVGYKVTEVHDRNNIKKILMESKQNLIMIDYSFGPSMLQLIENTYNSLGLAGRVMTILFNVPDPSGIQPSTVFQNMMFLGTSFSDRDIFKLITPMLSSRSGKQIQKSSHSSAMAGYIAGGNLLEVLQFIEIGSKTGCLLIELQKPFAIICFKKGRINFAATVDKINGRDAVFKVLALKEGRFRFVLDKKPRESNVNISTLEILMEWTKMIDEAHVN